MIRFSSKSPESETRQTAILISLLLVLVTTAVYWRVRGFDFVHYDDLEYITQNPRIQNGLSLNAIRWAFTTFYFCNWHPLTWLSYLLDFQLFGLQAGGYHLVNLVFHLANTVLLFLLFRKITRQIWQSAFVAAMFALHPMHVESVAWISERKDVLCVFFCILSIHAYARYVERPGWGRYIWVAVLFIFGLMSKPMAVTLPFVLLLLDYWPLGRMQPHMPGNKPFSTFAGLIAEKIPLFLLSAVSSVITFLAQRQGGAVLSFDHLPLTTRLANISVSYINYIAKALYPATLVVFYPYPHAISWWKVIAALLTLAGLTGLAIGRIRRNPYLIVGWLWFAGTLVPVIGLIQAGAQSMADRYMYLPMTGLLIIAAWGLPDLLARFRHKRALMGSLAIAAIAIATVITWVQIGYWQNNVKLFSHAIIMMPDNILAHYNLGEDYSREGELKKAMIQYEAVLKLNPKHHDSLINMGLTLLNMKKPANALDYINRALKIDPADSKAWRLKGYATAELGDYEKAIGYYEQALKTDSSNPELYYLMGVACNALGKQVPAVAYYRKALQLKPEDIQAGINLGNIYYRTGRMDLAGNAYEHALQYAPNNPDILSKLGAVALALGQVDRALPYFRQALKIQPDHPESLEGLKAVKQVQQRQKK